VGATMTKPAARAIIVEMAEPIILTTESPADGRALVALLGRHGLPARAAGAEVEIVSGREQVNLLLADLAVALRRWLDNRGLESIALRVGDRELVYDRAGRYRAGAGDCLAVDV
jgi:hypothetical protein